MILLKQKLDLALIDKYKQTYSGVTIEKLGEQFIQKNLENDTRIWSK